MRRAAFSPASSGTGCPASTTADLPRRQAVPVTGDGNAFEFVPDQLLLHRERHRGGGLAGGGDEGAAFRRTRQVRAHDLQRVGRGDGGLKLSSRSALGE